MSTLPVTGINSPLTTSHTNAPNKTDAESSIVHACSPSTKGAEAGELLQAGQSRPQNEFKAGLSSTGRPGLKPYQTHACK